jgi:transcriptional regulator with XRE-family HTH domain
VPVHVRVRSGQALREWIESKGRSHADVAMEAGLAPARLSQLLSETAPGIAVAQAARLEDVLEVPRGTFFAFSESDAELAAAYLTGDDPTAGGPGATSRPVEAPGGPIEHGDA